MTVATLPFFDMLVDGSPTAQVEISNAEVCMVGDFHRFSQSRTKVLFNIIEDARH